MTITLRMAWRNLWRHKRRTWLTVGAMIFSNLILVFSISLQFGSYRMMIDNTLKSYTGHMQIQREGYTKNRKCVAALMQSFLWPMKYANSLAVRRLLHVVLRLP